MPIIDVLIVTAIVLAFVVFGMTLAWAEYQTRHLPAPAPQSVPRSVPQRVGKPKVGSRPATLQANAAFH